MQTTSPDFATLRAIEQLYGRWLNGELASEDLLFLLGDLLQDDEGGASKSSRRAAVAAAHRSA